MLFCGGLHGWPVGFHFESKQWGNAGGLGMRNIEASLPNHTAKVSLSGCALDWILY